jgi:hypothetical protein
MNKHNVSIIAVIITCAFLFSSCGSKMSNNKRLAFDSIKVNQTEHLFGDKKKPYCNLIINMAYPNVCDNASLKDTLTKSIISFCLGADYANLAPLAAVRSYTKNYLSNYRKELEPNFKQEADSSVFQWYNYYRSIIGKVKFQKHDVLTYEMNFNEYTGGAHNMYATTYESFDLKRMKDVKLNDLFKPNYQNELTAIIVKQLLTDMHVRTVGELTEKGYGSTGNISPTENFYFSKDGMTFVYNIYEIAPYSLGIISVHIDYDKLKSIMEPSIFKSLGLI